MSKAAALNTLYPGLSGSERREAIRRDWVLPPDQKSGRMLPCTFDNHGRPANVIVTRHPLNNRNYATLRELYTDRMLKDGYNNDDAGVGTLVVALPVRIVQGGGVVVQRGLGRTDSVSFSQARRLEPIVLPRCENNIQWDNPYYCVMKPSKCTSITMLLANETALQYRGPSKPAVQHRSSDVGPVCEQRIASSVMLCGVSYKGGGPAS